MDEKKEKGREDRNEKMLNNTSKALANGREEMQQYA